MKLLGVDIGTTGVKAAVFDEDGHLLGYGFHEYDVLASEPGYAEQDAELVWQFTKTVMADAARQAGGDIAAVSLSTQGDAIIPMDIHRRALCRAQLGMDYRGIKENDEIIRLFGERVLFDKTGIRPHPLNALIKIMWFMNHRPQMHEKVWKYATYADFILAKMGSDDAVIDNTMASRTMCFDLKTFSWSQEILTAVGLDVSCLSKPVPSGTVVGQFSVDLCAELGIEYGAKIVTGGHDQPCAALGAGIDQENRALDSHGTAEVLSTALKEPRTDDIMFDSFYPCYCHVVKGMYFTFALNHTGGILLKWYRDNLGYAEVVKAEQSGERSFEQIVKSVPDGPSPLLVLPHFSGSGTPTCDIRSKGAIVGLTMSSSRHDIAKGIMDSLAFELRNNLVAMKKAGMNIDQLLCVGGGARSTIDLQLKADVTGLPVSTLQIREAACLGASILAGTGIGLYSNTHEATALIKQDMTYYPDQKMHERYNEKYSLYSCLYPALKSINSKMKSW